VHYLKGGPEPNLPEATMFETGSNVWRRYDVWPPANAERRTLYLAPQGKLAFTPPPSSGSAFDQYVSDPAKPVPTVDWIHFGLPREYMVADQRFAARRPDVLVYQTEPLTEDLTVVGPISPVLHVSTTGTDADFIVKLIDVYPDSASGDQENVPMGFRAGGWQRLVRGEPFRGRFRRSFEKPIPFVPGRADSIAFTMPDIDHTFKAGHRIMVQIQSTWFPHIDRNPQTFVPNIFYAKATDFRPATMRVYHSPAAPTRLELLVLRPGR
jgi:putative CocE/NonD family hydrolase